MVTDKKPKWVWMDGKFVPYTEANVPIDAHALHYGTSVFEGIRFYKINDEKFAIFRWPEHIGRLERSAEFLYMEIPYPKDKFRTLKEYFDSVIEELVAINGLEEGYIRPLVYVGDGPLGVNLLHKPVRIALLALEWGKYIGDSAKVVIVDTIRNHPKAFPSGLKVGGSYAVSAHATAEARLSDYDEAIQLDHRGYVSEGPGENIFMVKDGKLITPSDDCSILPGFTRDTIMQIAKDNGMRVKKRRIKPEELLKADEVFYTGTAAEVTPIVSIHYKGKDMIIGDGKIGPKTNQLRTLYGDVVRGKIPKYEHWLTPFKINPNKQLLLFEA